MRLFLIRHAQSANNALPEEQRVEDPAITDLGHRQAEALADWLAGMQLQQLVTSPFRRSLQTTEYVRRRLGLTPHVWVDLHEQGGCYAGWEPGKRTGRPGMNRQQILAEFPGYEIEPPLGEDGWWNNKPYELHESARSRASRLLQRALETFGDAGVSVAFVMHADFKGLFLAELFAREGNADAWEDIFNTAVTEIEFRRGIPELRVFNSIAHLPEEWLSK